jgi:DNA-binding HxlR family transcriptional regulator
MLGKDYSSQACSIAGALEVIGERWSLLIVRDVLLGLRRFDELQAELGIARNVLQARLSSLTDEGVLERRRYQERPPRYEYRLTQKGLDLWPALVALLRWGDRYAAPADGPATRLEHAGCGGPVDEHLTCERCGERLTVRDARALPGPGASGAHPLLRQRLELSARRETSAAPSRAKRERGTTRSKPARSARSRTSAST